VRAEMVTDAEVSVCPRITLLINVSCREYLGRKSTERMILRGTILMKITVRSLALVMMLGAGWQVRALDATTPYPSMAPLEQYLIADRDAEIALARSAASESISRDADILILGRHGYETAIKGKNGFVCFVQRSWAAGPDDPEFWNPKLRSPICLNRPAARSFLPLIIKKTEWVLAGRSKAQISEDLQAAFDKKDLPTLEPGAMSYMQSKEGYVSDNGGHWHPHIMFFVPLAEAQTWGANLPGSRFWQLRTLRSA
jgi:hypothetical protein